MKSQNKQTIAMVFVSIVFLTSNYIADTVSNFILTF